ncbi:MAG: tRNA 2-thiocytidine biosynthesis protein TtcA, partial [Spirochaetaceae bacterium]|nr:tRNA 2-thiocytidine biosynthesis protein TtcA [Spirochaetaceae bacterium]
EFLTKMDVPYTSLFVPVLARLKQGRKMNCYWCSSQRRMELMKFADENGFNKIALGHHMDDILETFFMNMSYKGELSTMLPVLNYDNYNQTVIRPLALVKEKEIIAFADKKEIRNLTCTCPYGRKSKRKDMREVIDYMAQEDESIRDNLYRALSNPVPRYMFNHDEN